MKGNGHNCLVSQDLIISMGVVLASMEERKLSVSGLLDFQPFQKF